LAARRAVLGQFSLFLPFRTFETVILVTPAASAISSKVAMSEYPSAENLNTILCYAVRFTTKTEFKHGSNAKMASPTPLLTKSAATIIVTWLRYLEVL
jgi:hypothetical protein